MNDAELAEPLVANHAMTKPDARKAVDDIMAAIVTAASKGDEVSLAGFGKFKVKDSPAGEGPNHSTGEAIQIAAAKKLTFVPPRWSRTRSTDERPRPLCQLGQPVQG
jgi:DNA-binding protein HU-beta